MDVERIQFECVNVVEYDDHGETRRIYQVRVAGWQAFGSEWSIPQSITPGGSASKRIEWMF